MRNPGGYIIWQGGGMPPAEQDTFTCFHCSQVVFVKPRMDPSEFGGFCRLCMKLVCPHCADKGCDPFEKKMERVEARDRLMASVLG